MDNLRPPDLRENGVHVWSARLDEMETNSAEALLSAEERARAARMSIEKRRREFTAGRYGLRRLVALYRPIPPAEVSLVVDANGKPEFDAGANPLGISLSHSDGRFVYAIAAGTVGVDLERRRAIDVNALASKIFSPAETARLAERADESARLDFFFDLWTRKEAVAKLLGLGLRASFPRLEIDGDGATYAGATFATRGFDWDEYRVAVASAARDARFEWRGSFLP